jgi:hypothetical protein
MATITLENASLAVQADARYDLTVLGPDGREHRVTGWIPPNIRDVRLARGVFQAMTDIDPTCYAAKVEAHVQTTLPF